MEDKKDKNQHPQVPEGNSGGNENSKSPDNKALFLHLGTSDQGFIFQYKKTEKILAALYLVTNFLSTQEPLRWELRELGLSLLSNVMSFKDALPSQKDELCKSIKTTVFEMISLLQIAHFAGFISSMNFEILKKEFVLLMDSVSSTKQSLESFVLPNDFFVEEVSDEIDTKSIAHGGYLPGNFPSARIKDKKINPLIGGNFKGQNTTKHSNVAKKTHSEMVLPGRVEVKKSNRQHVIIDLLKKKKEIMVKDVAQLIGDCSEKTLQRELLSMVEQGILKKEGERRWSRYSLA